LAALRVLLVEDDAPLRLMALYFLQEEGFDVTEAATGDDAVMRLADEDCFDVLFTDIQTPGEKDGIDVAFRARELYPLIAVIVASGFEAPLVERLDMLNPPAVFFSKPYRAKEILSAIRQLTS
jgi:two-component system, response regulator PdtaR